MVSGGTVYAGGYSANSSGVAVTGYWQGGTWIGLTPPTGSIGAAVTSLVVSGGTVYAGGYSINGVPVAGYWQGGTWIGLTPLASGSSYVSSLVVQ
jgi:hypothetical protein